MRMTFTEQGDLEIALDHELEKDLLEFIILDARREGPQTLCRDFYKQKKNDDFFEDWQEFCLPDIEAEFSAQLAKMQFYIKKINDKKPTIIKNADLKACFGAINQARFALEKYFQFSKYPNPYKLKTAKETNKLRALMESWTTEKQLAFQRELFYASFIQSFLEGFAEIP